MKELVQKEMSKLERDFTSEEIKESWYYAALQRLAADNNNTIKQVVQKNLNTNDRLKEELIKFACTLQNPSQARKITNFINKNVMNVFYSNIIKGVVLVLKKTEEGLTLNEAKKVIYQNTDDFSGFEIAYINSLAPFFYQDENTKQYKL